MRTMNLLSFNQPYWESETFPQILESRPYSDIFGKMKWALKEVGSCGAGARLNLLEMLTVLKSKDSYSYSYNTFFS